MFADRAGHDRAPIVGLRVFWSDRPGRDPHHGRRKLFIPQVLNDGDTWWHLAAAEWIINHQAAPHADPFSYTRAGAPWLDHEWLSQAIAPILLSAPLARAFPGGAAEERRRPASWALLCLLAGAGVALIGLRLSMPILRRDEAAAPATALAAVPAGTRAGRVLNDYAFGGFLIWRGVAPFIDGRADLYGDRFLAAYGAIVRPDRVALEKALTAYAVTWTIFPPDEPVVGLMDREPGWRRAYADRYAVVHVRTGGAVEGAKGPRL